MQTKEMARRFLKMRVEQLRMIDEQEVGQWAMHELPEEAAEQFDSFTEKEMDEFFVAYHHALSDVLGGVS